MRLKQSLDVVCQLQEYEQEKEKGGGSRKSEGVVTYQKTWIVSCIMMIGGR